MNVMQEKRPVSRAGGHRAGNYFQSKGTSGGKKDVVLSHFEFDNCVSFILSSFPPAFQESSPRGFMRRSPLSKALLFTGIIQRTYLEVEFLSFRYTYRVGKEVSGSCKFYEKGSPALAWLWPVALRGFPADLARHLLDKGGTAIDSLGGDF